MEEGGKGNSCVLDEGRGGGRGGEGRGEKGAKGGKEREWAVEKEERTGGEGGV